MRKKASGAGNQQERSPIEIIISPNIGWYLSGFADGEGSFNVSTINRNQDYRSGWKIVATFNISQRDHSVLYLFQKNLGCGTIHDRKDGVGYFDVRRISDHINIVIPFFESFPVFSEYKQKQFKMFQAVCKIMHRREHLTKEGMQRILDLRDTIIVGRKRKYSKRQILQTFQ